MFEGFDEVERAKLEEAISGLQRFMGAGGVGSGSTSMLVGVALADAEHRLQTLEENGIGGSGERERKEEKKFQDLYVGYLVQQEANLTSAERQQFTSFLESPFFTRADFHELIDFYGSAYDRLSDRGKAEMSHRVWEGIRQGEYQFTELPENVRNKEMERLMGVLSDPEKMPENLKRIPEKDREDFMAAINAGKRDEAAQILNREGFTNNVSTSEELEQSPQTENAKEAEAEKSDTPSADQELGEISFSLTEADEPSPPNTGISNNSSNYLG